MDNEQAPLTYAELNASINRGTALLRPADSFRFPIAARYIAEHQGTLEAARSAWNSLSHAGRNRYSPDDAFAWVKSLFGRRL